MKPRRMKPRRTIAALAAIAASAGFAACGGGDQGGDGASGSATDQAAQGASVTIATFMYEPDPLEVDAGTTVTFTNEDRILHTVTEGTRENPVKGGFDEQLDGAGTTAEITFDEPGKVEYFCSIHNGMDGTVVVR